MYEDVKLESLDPNDYDIYLRKSRKDLEFNVDESIEKTLERHEKQLQEFAKRIFGSPIPEENIFREVVSGDTIDDRPEMQRILHRLEDGSRKGVLVLEIERLARGNTIDQGIIAQAFQYSNTKILTPMKIFDLSNEFDQTYFEDGLYQSRKFLVYTKKILNRGRMQSVKEGKYVGSITPFGYDKIKLENEKGYKLVQNEESDTVKLIFRLFLEDNIGTCNIAHYLNNVGAEARNGDFWTPAMIRNIIINPVHCGKLTWNRRKTEKKLVNGSIVKSNPIHDTYLLVDGLHEGIISEEQWNQAQEKLKANSSKKVPNNKTMKNPLSGLIKCGCCGRTMKRRPYNDKQITIRKRKYNINKEELSAFLREYKEKSGLSLSEIANQINISKYIVDHWFSKTKFTIPTHDKWFDLKTVLKIDSDIFDKQLTTLENKSIARYPDTLICSIARCKNVSSDLSLVEDRIIKALEIKLKQMKYYLNNYESEFIKKEKDNSNIIMQIEKDIQKLSKQHEKACELLETGVYSIEIFKDRQILIQGQIKSKQAQKKQLEVEMKEDKTIQYKKAIPNIEYCLKMYYKCESIEDKNKMLTSIIESVIYKKEKGGRWNPDAIDNFELDLNLKF